MTIDLHWLVEQAIDADYTTSVQIFDANGAKIGQHDSPPGGVYYPTSLWKLGERLVDSHQLAITEPAVPHTLLIAMYKGPGAELLAPSLELGLPAAGTEE